MKVFSFIRVVVIALSVFGLSAGAASAAPITYTVSATASGMLGFTSFTNALVTMTLTGDTSNVALVGVFDANPGTMKVTVSGIGTANVPVPTAIYSSPVALSFPGFPNQPGVIFGTLDSPPSLASFTGTAALFSNALLGYDLRTSIGPIALPPGAVGFGSPCCTIPTTFGMLSFATLGGPTGTAGTFTAVATPEPMTVVLLGSGLAGLVARSRRRRA